MKFKNLAIGVIVVCVIFGLIVGLEYSTPGTVNLVKAGESSSSYRRYIMTETNSEDNGIPRIWSEGGNSSEAVETNYISMENTKFVPKDVVWSIEKFGFDSDGDGLKDSVEVNWINNDNKVHDVHIHNSSGSMVDHSPDLNPGESWSYNFTAFGEYDIHCEIHPGMTGTVIITTEADINKDGIVNILDLDIEDTAFGTTPGDPNWNPDADLNEDGIVDIYDLVIVAKNYGATIP